MVVMCRGIGETKTTLGTACYYFRFSEKKVWQEGGGIVAGGSMQTFLHIIEGKTRLGRFLRLQGGIDS